jgi:hypothetical protein
MPISRVSSTVLTERFSTDAFIGLTDEIREIKGTDVQRNRSCLIVFCWAFKAPLLKKEASCQNLKKLNFLYLAKQIVLSFKEYFFSLNSINQ